MKLDSPFFGTLEYSPRDVFYAHSGLLGFPDDNRYVIIQGEESYPFYWFQSIDNTHISFAVVDPKHFVPDYRVELGVQDLTELNIQSETEATAFTVTVMSKDPSLITTNLQAPLIVSVANKRIKQIILPDDRYSLRHPLFCKEREEGNERSETEGKVC